MELFDTQFVHFDKVLLVSGVISRSHGVVVALYKARAVGMELCADCTIEPITAKSKARKMAYNPQE